MDSIHEEDWSEFSREWPYVLESRDREGKPG
jgi:hypothetical protein